MKEKKGKKEKGKKRLAAASTDRREGAARQLHGGTRRAYCLHEKLKSSVGSNFSHAVVLSPPFGYMALSHLARILMPLHSFVLQLPSPSCCVWSQLSFFFTLHLEPLQHNFNCDITVTTTSPSAHTGHTPSSPPPTPSLPPQHRRYFTNPVAVTTAATPPLTLTLTCVAWHKNHPAAIILTVPGAT